MMWLGVIAWSVSAGMVQEPPAPVQAEPQTVEEWLARVEEKLLGARSLRIQTEYRWSGDSDPESDLPIVEHEQELTLHARLDSGLVAYRSTSIERRTSAGEEEVRKRHQLVAGPSDGEWRVRTEGAGVDPGEADRRHRFGVRGNPARGLLCYLTGENLLSFDWMFDPGLEEIDFSQPPPSPLPGLAITARREEESVEHVVEAGRRLVVLRYVQVSVVSLPEGGGESRTRIATWVDEERCVPVRTEFEIPGAGQGGGTCTVNFDEEIPDAEFTIRD